MKVMVIAPVWNEEKRIGEVIRSIPRDCVDEIVVVDDGSVDGSVRQAREHGAAVIAHDRNRGVGAAIRSGIEYGLKNGFDIITVMSGSGKTPGEEIPRLIAPILESGFDFVQGSRYLHGGRWENLPMHRRVGTKLYSAIFSHCVRCKVTDGSSGFRAFRSAIFDDNRIDLWQVWLDHYELEPYLYYKIITLGYRYLEVPVTIHYPHDADGSITKMKWYKDWWRITRPLIYLRTGLKE